MNILMQTSLEALSSSNVLLLCETETRSSISGKLTFSSPVKNFPQVTGVKLSWQQFF